MPGEGAPADLMHCDSGVLSRRDFISIVVRDCLMLAGFAFLTFLAVGGMAPPKEVGADGRLNRRAPLLLLVSVFIVAVLGGFVASATGTGPGAFRTAEAGEPSYALTGLTVEFPYRAPDGTVDEGKAGVGYDIAWTTATYPGTAECEVRVLDAEGTVNRVSQIRVPELGACVQ